MHLAKIFVVLSFVGLWSVCSAYRILGVFPLNAKSHNILFEALMKGLAKHGHHVDVITHFPLKKPLKNYNDIINLDGSLESLMNNYTVEFATTMKDNVVDYIAEAYGNRVCQFLGFESIQNLIKNPPNDPPYDLVITEAFTANCYMGIGYVLNVPVIAISSAVEYPWISDFTGNGDNPAIVPNIKMIGSGIMNFWQRMNNVLINHELVYTFHKITEENQTQAMRQFLRSDMPSIREVEKNVALIFVNSHPILFGVKPVIPTLVQIAGLHVEGNDDTLPPELQKWMDESTSGVVYFTFGSMVLIETLPLKQMNELYSSFKKIAPVRVLMKIADDSKLPPGLPKNVKILPWAPQQPILAHPNTKIFITHCGLGGIIEALYYGVPMLGIPLFGDQFQNIQAVVDKQMAIRINYNDFSETSLDLALKALLYNSSYKEKATYYSKLFRDQPLSPMNIAIFWIEYLIRNGPNTMRSPFHQFTWWQLSLLDIYGAMTLIIILCFITIVYSIKLIFNNLAKKSSNEIFKKKVH